MENQIYYEVTYGVLDREGNVDLFPQTHSGENFQSLVRTAQGFVRSQLPQRLYKAFFYQNGVRIGAYVRAELFDLLTSKTVNQ